MLSREPRRHPSSGSWSHSQPCPGPAFPTTFSLCGELVLLQPGWPCPMYLAFSLRHSWINPPAHLDKLISLKNLFHSSLGLYFSSVIFLFITTVSFCLCSSFHAFHSLSLSVPGHWTLPAFPSRGESAEPFHSPQFDISPCPSFLQMFPLTWVNPQFIPSLLPSISSPWIHVGPMDSTVLKDSGALAHSNKTGGCLRAFYHCAW